mmetsp:Transcript_19052/g.23374  ORF Transcript_19052/g.23374 Transcript_19052/m.23374 type:complete len:288 (-) Transcript_19052:368-1231(-)|eukprot:CAMPEP_0204845536 /NCGR_PEP_ID=MMETSP1347-20130617/1248_1 /ASSEMBLY_ACC=CAM_ASM_000690 /TAXON_ID=215587 /ORGANISM="Aplanochytrium stocchinoi, Strain GSBS06" /LENGTH=287 /DNA_ID=CAMNT_0051985653 /DNA_START=406 /DNA_END=1269 /DNA_ORIENTATION=+
MAFASVAQTLPADEGDLHRLIYKSKLRVNENSGSADDLLNQILFKAIRKNPSKRISGMLYFNRQSMAIIQVLEGPTANVQELYKVIEQDPRHDEVVLLVEEKATRRRYGEWGMLKGNEDDWLEIKKFLPNPKEWRDMPGFDLNLVEKLPIAGDLDVELVRITYHSWMLKQSTPEKQNLLMDNILEIAQSLNKKKLIGGMLYYNTESRDVFQCIEGPANAVDELYAKITQDLRHEHVKLILREVIDERRYKAFGMLWANEADSVAILDNLPEGVVDEIAKHQHTLKQE